VTANLLFQECRKLGMGSVYRRAAAFNSLECESRPSIFNKSKSYLLALRRHFERIPDFADFTGVCSCRFRSGRPGLHL